VSALELGVIGNCTISALIDRQGGIVWSCLPRLDGDPVFCALLDGGRPGAEEARGIFSLELVGQTGAEQAYVPNTAILRTELRDADGGAVEVLDFAPRYVRYERMFRPPMLVRRLRRLSGRPRLRVRLRPRFDYGATDPVITRGSNHVRYVSPAFALRLTTDVPLSYVVGERPFLLQDTANLLFGADEPLWAGIEESSRHLYERTRDYWRDWVRSLSVPFEWQDAVIRAAITLKLCNFEETGAIVAALTTSIPEAAGTERNWDYRFCWLRDAYFVIHALNRLGVTKTMEDYLAFISNIVDDAKEEGLRPVYGIARDSDLAETTAPALCGYRGYGPVRVGNQAHEQVQHDVYGSIVLASTHAFFDQRLVRPVNHELFERLEAVGRRAIAVFDQPDAGPWELRTKAAVHTFSAVVCWAACHRLAKIAAHIDRPDNAAWWRQQADRLHEEICARAWNSELGSFVATFDGSDMDATLLLLHEFDFLTADDPRFAATVDAVGSALRRGDFLLRYAGEDDFGRPETAFVICVFWYIDALAALGRTDEARRLFNNMLESRNALGLLSEDIDFRTGELWGNFPQTYSMVGLINSAMRLSRSWEKAF
jgi:pentatricopeptide repeat protein